MATESGRCWALGLARQLAEGGSSAGTLEASNGHLGVRRRYAVWQEGWDSGRAVAHRMDGGQKLKSWAGDEERKGKRAARAEKTRVNEGRAAGAALAWAWFGVGVARGGAEREWNQHEPRPCSLLAVVFYLLHTHRVLVPSGEAAGNGRVTCLMRSL